MGARPPGGLGSSHVTLGAGNGHQTGVTVEKHGDRVLPLKHCPRCGVGRDGVLDVQAEGGEVERLGVLAVQVE